MHKNSILIVVFFLLTSCAEYQTYTPAPVDTEQSARNYGSRTLDSAEIKNWLLENDQKIISWPKEKWDVESLVLIGNYFSHDLAIANAEVEVAKAAEITAGQKPNPEIDLSAEHHSDQPGGVSPWTFGSIFSWIYERPQKRQARIDHARAKTEVANLKQYEIKWNIRDQITDHFLDSIAADHKKKMLEEEKEVLEQGLTILDRRIELGQASEFEISSSRLELQRLRLLINETEAERIRSRSRLALASGLSAASLEYVELDNDYFSQLPYIHINDLDLEVLQARALTERPDMLRLLSQYLVAEADLHRQIENQYSDVTLSPGYIFDQHDNLWVFGSSWALPLNAKNEGPIAEAEARRKVGEQEILARQTEILGQVHNARIRYQISLQTLAGAGLIIYELSERGKKLQRQYDLGYSDRLSIIRNQLEILLAKRSLYLLELSAWREFNILEDSLMQKLINN